MKKNGRITSSHTGVELSHDEYNPQHFRLCHLCLHLNEAEEEIDSCSQCHHLFKDEILTQFFDNEDDEAFTDGTPTPSEFQRLTEGETSKEDSKALKISYELSGLSVRF